MRGFTVLLTGALLSCSGCTLIQAAVKARKKAQVEELEAKGDYEGLQVLCRDGSNRACEAKGRVGAKRLAASSCSDITPNIEKYYDNHAGTREGDLQLVHKLATCKQYAALFGRDLRIRWLPEALAKADEHGDPLFEPFVTHLASGRDAYGGEHGRHRLERLTRWLIDVGDDDRCAPVDEQIGRVAPESHDVVLHFFAEVGCGEQAAPHARDALLHEAPGRRIQACEILGEYGSPADLEPLEVLSQSDGYKAERDVRTPSGALAVEVYFPVRESCQAAAGKLRVRERVGAEARL
jgi:hypothetical protein